MWSRDQALPRAHPHRGVQRRAQGDLRHEPGQPHQEEETGDQEVVLRALTRVGARLVLRANYWALAESHQIKFVLPYLFFSHSQFNKNEQKVLIQFVNHVIWAV